MALLVAFNRPLSPAGVPAIGGAAHRASPPVRPLAWPQILARLIIMVLAGCPGFAQEAVGHRAALAHPALHLVYQDLFLKVIAPGTADDLQSVIGLNQGENRHHLMSGAEHNGTGVFVRHLN